ncbi:hypothetical protein OG21DRAFT_1490775 [Imleria badia]|nr:hypothetical protein OG21DRAFT_1490775 [Imleria badia]
MAVIWDYFMQMLLALQHCRHPPNLGSDLDGKDRRPQIFHRDLKLDNIFLDDIHSVESASTSKLSSAVKAMVNMNPAMRPFAAQLLRHERLTLGIIIIEAEKMFVSPDACRYSMVKMHKSAVISRGRKLSVRETALVEREAELTTERIQGLPVCITLFRQLSLSPTREFEKQ